MTTELVVRYVDLSQAQSERLQIGTTIEDGRPVEPGRISLPTWLAVSQVTGSAIGDRYILYFLSADGRWIDFAQRLSLDEAIDEVGGVVQREEWRVCSLILSDEWEQIPRESIA
jgi:hypothetical protein